MKLLWSVAVLAGLLVFAGAPATGSQQAVNDTRPNRFEGLDRNRDGVITRSEWRGNDRSFRNHDWNGDGVLSGDEVDPAGQRNGRSEQFDETDWSEARFLELDRNNDGRIGPREWPGALEAFDRIDRDRDRFISLREFLGYDSDDPPAGRIAIDGNRDGRISRSEWRGDQQEFAWLDRNGNGYLEGRELNEVERSRPDDEFAGLDVNGDGLISRDEWPNTWSAFDGLDRNGDDVLTRAEYARGNGRVDNRDSRAYRAGYQRGIEEGRQAGREDRARNNWDLDGQRELERADSGYQPSFGPLSDYQSGYREGFRLGYGEGFGRR